MKDETMKTYIVYAERTESLSEIYLDWVNNYLTIEKFAEHYGLYPKEAEILINLARDCLYEEHPEA